MSLPDAMRHRVEEGIEQDHSLPALAGFVGTRCGLAPREAFAIINPIQMEMRASSSGEEASA